MDQSLGLKILAVHEKARNDEEYQALVEEYRVLDARFMEQYPTLTKPQKDAVLDYIGLLYSMHLKMMVLALSE